jgi:hypothetical protein
LKTLSTEFFPTYGDILRFYLYHIEKTSSRQAKICNAIADIIIHSWTACMFLTKPKRSIVRLVNCLIQQYTNLVKSKSKSSIAEEARRQEFSSHLESIFDAKCNGINDDADKQMDKKSSKRKLDCEITEKDSQDLLIGENNQNDPDFSVSLPKHLKYDSTTQKSSNRLKQIIESPKITSIMDRLNMSDREGVMMIGTVASVIGEDLEKGTLSRTSLRRFREKNRHQITVNIKNDQNWICGPLVIHWDGKKLPNSTNSNDPKNKIERHGVTVTGN